MWKVVSSGAIALIIASACGSTAVTPTSTPVATATATATPSATPLVDHSVVYLARDRLPPVGVHLKGAGDGATAEARIFSRVDGLWTVSGTSDEFNVVRMSKARLAKVTVAGDLATIDFTVPNDDWATAGSAGIRAFVQQLVYTASEEPAIRRVLITQNGGEQAIIGGEGLVIDHPAAREDVAGYTVKGSLETVRSYESDAAPATPTATLASRYWVDEIAPGLARLEVTLVRPGGGAHWLPTFDVTVSPEGTLAGTAGAKWELDLTVHDGTDLASNATVDRTPLRQVAVDSTPGTQLTVYRLALDDLRPWRVGVAFDPVRIVLDIGGDPSAVNANVAVYRPAFGEKSSGALTLSGMTRAFEATFQYRLTDTLGRALVSDHGMASYGTSPIWGVFDLGVPSIPANAANLEVFLRSPKDGEITDLVTVPIAVSR